MTSPREVRTAGGLLVAIWIVLTMRAELDVLTIAWVVLAGLAFAVARARPQLSEVAFETLRKPSLRAFLLATASVAALLSFLVVTGPMHDRPHSIDANVYLFQARALSHFHFGVPIPEPRTLFGGRFLFEGADGKLTGVFPPGYPLFLVPFVWIGMPLLAGPVTAVALALAQWLLGRAIEGEDGVATRLAVLLSLPSFARAIETADLLSHAFVAVLATVAIALALLLLEKASVARALAIGAAVGWATASRLLDGIVIGFVVGAIVIYGVVQRKVSIGLVLSMIGAALPFVALVLVEQKAATGSFRVPTQSVYFARSDWPPTCHRLGFGADVGCAVEHEKERASFGPDGYGLDDAFRIVRQRASMLGVDLFGLSWIGIGGFAAVAAWGRKRDALLAGAVVVFTLAYGLFYYGNAPAFGARHLFPIAPALLLLVARAAEKMPAAAIAVSVTVLISCVPRWIAGSEVVRRAQSGRIDVRGVIARGEFERGMFVTGDEMSWISAFDPYRDGDARVLVRFDGSGLKDLRRLRPDLIVHSLLEGDQIQTAKLAAPPPGLLVELERAWPSFIQRTGDVGMKVEKSQQCCQLDASGDRVLFVFHGTEGASLSIPFYAPKSGSFALRVDSLVAPDYGIWSTAIDGAPLSTIDGYGEKVALKKGEPQVRELSAGTHVLTLKCVGKNPASKGLSMSFDALVGEPAH
ncbi:MAG: hypothetical protein ACXVEF_05390 [Polyangiales bacterium]